MNTPTSQNDVIAEKRRAIVSELRVKGMTIDEIKEGLIQRGIVNPATGKPFGRTIIFDDIKRIKETWIQYQIEKIEEQKARHLEEVNQAKLIALEKDNLKAYISALNHEAKVMGFYAPVKSEQSIDLKEKQSAKEKLLHILTNNIESQKNSNVQSNQ